MKSLLLLLFAALAAGAAELPLKQHSAFYGPDRLGQIRRNLQQLPEGARLKQQALERADYWLRLPDDELWGLMFGPSITRSWMVWSNGHCPGCTNSVTMYNWKIDAQKHPWKVQCPHCQEYFPKNDFQAYYRSGLNAQHVFEPKLADRKLLFNAEHPGETDPLRTFGVDDGEGFVAGDKRWRFIGAYLVYGQFKQLVRDGAQALGLAFVLTGDTNCARKAGILLDRVADLYPAFDYAAQGLVYERPGSAGYVSVWHDTCEETRELVLAYDQVFAALPHDPSLVEFLSAKARACGLPNAKQSFRDIQRNIEERLLRDALNTPAKMHSNFPRREIAYTIIQAVLGWPENRPALQAYLDSFVKTATAVDGVTGEKGLGGYTSFTLIGLASLLGEFARGDQQFLKELLDRNPSLRQTWRFHIDTFCLDRFYPNSGDSGSFAEPAQGYMGAAFARLNQPRLEPSMFTFFWQLYEATGDPAYVQMLYRENGDTVSGLPHDLCAADPGRIRDGVRELIAKQGPRPQLASVHKPAWHIGILRSGRDAHARALWLDYDAGGAHGHADAMTLGLFARGRDLLPEFGYPPVQHGGWTTPQVAWYLSPPAHNTAVVDGRGQNPGAGQCTLWAEGEQFHAIRASAPALVGIQQFQRTAILVDLSPEQFYVLDLFRLSGGSDHAKFVHGPKAEMTAAGLNLSAGEPYGHGALMRNFQRDTQPPLGWSAEWKLPGAKDSSRPALMRYTDFSEGVQAFTAEANVMPYKSPSSPNGFWNPALLVRHQGTAPLRTAFVSLLEVFEARSPLAKVRRLPVRHAGSGACTNDCVALALALADGRADLFLAAAPEHADNPMVLEDAKWTGAFAGEYCWLRRDKHGKAERLALCRAASLQLSDLRVECDRAADLLEVAFTGKSARIISGSPSQLRLVRQGNRALNLQTPAPHRN